MDLSIRLRTAHRALAAIIALAGALVALTIPAGADDDRGQLRIGTSSSGAVVLAWRGVIAAPMAQQIREAFEQRKSQSSRVIFNISSGGGAVAEAERVIDVLRHIKRTHKLETVVGHGQTCGSMCVFLYVQGDRRVGALSSTWLFHEISHSDPYTKRIVRLDRGHWERMVHKYFPPAGISEGWIADMKPQTVASDYWQTGADLVAAKSGFFTEALGNQMARAVPGSTGAAEEPQRVQPRPAESAKETARAEPQPPQPECAKLFLWGGAVVRIPCS